jgi:hypothetical protein
MKCLRVLAQDACWFEKQACELHKTPSRRGLREGRLENSKQGVTLRIESKA